MIENINNAGAPCMEVAGALAYIHVFQNDSTVIF